MTEIERLERRGSRELKNMIVALSFHPWNNTDEENDRVRAAKIVLEGRKK